MRHAIAALALAGAIGTAAPARAQVYVQVLGGMTKAAETKPFIAGALGARVGLIEVSGEVGRMQDVLPKGLFDALNQLQAGSPVKATARLRNTYGLVNVRLIAPTGVIRPFVGGGVGIAHLEPGFEVTVGGISLGDVFGLTSAEPQNKAMWTAGGGLSVDLPKSSVEVGYRLFRIDTGFSGFNTSSVPVTIHAVYGGLAVRF